MNGVGEQLQGDTFEPEDLFLGAAVLDLDTPLAFRDSVLYLLLLFVEFRGPHAQPLEFSHGLGDIRSVYVQLSAERKR